MASPRAKKWAHVASRLEKAGQRESLESVWGGFLVSSCLLCSCFLQRVLVKSICVERGSKLKYSHVTMCGGG